MDDPLLKHIGTKGHKQFDRQFDKCRLQYNLIKQKNDLIQKTSDAELDSDMIKQFQNQGDMLEKQISSLNAKLNRLKSEYKNPEFQNKIKHLKKDLINQIQRHKLLMTNYINRTSSGSFMRKSVNKDSINSDKNFQRYTSKRKSLQKITPYQTLTNQEENHLVLSQQQNSDLLMEMQAQKQKMQFIKNIEVRMNRVQNIVQDTSQEVDKQGQNVNLISENMNKAYNNVQNANEQLQTAATYQKKTKKRYVFCLGIIIVAALLAGGLTYLFVN